MTNKFLTAAAVLMLGFTTVTNAQKIAHVNSNDLMLLMPERKQAETTLQDFAKELEKQMMGMNQEYETKVGEYQKLSASMTDVIKQDKEKEIIDLETRIKNFQQTAQESLQKKESDLLAPMMEKAKKAINDVAKEAGYKYVLDTAVGAVLYSEATDDILPAVKKKLGIDASTVAPSKQNEGKKETPPAKGK